MTGPEATHMKKTSILLPDHSPCSPHDVEEPRRQPVLSDEGGDPPEGASSVASPEDLVARSPEGGGSGSETVLHPRPRRRIALPSFGFLHQDDVSSKLAPPGTIEGKEFVKREGHRGEREALHPLMPEPAPYVMGHDPAARG